MQSAYLYILVLQCLYIKSNRWNGLHCLVAFVLQPVKNRGFTSVVETENQDPYLLGSKQGLEDFTHHDAHFATTYVTT